LLDCDHLEELFVVLEHVFERGGSIVVEVRRGAGNPAQARVVEVLDVAGAARGAPTRLTVATPPKGSSVNRTSARLASIAESATLAVDAKAKALQAKGENVIGFGAGEPDFPTPANVVEAAARACHEVRYHKYTPAAGLPELRDAIATKTMRDSGFQCQASQVLVTNGGKHAVFTAFAALCDPGDEVICPAPYWTTYPEAITLAGGAPVVVQTDETTGGQDTGNQFGDYNSLSGIGGTFWPSTSSVPAATIEPLPTCAPFRTIAPIPIRHSSSMVQPWSTDP
jgi:hypothetical protein